MSIDRNRFGTAIPKEILGAAGALTILLAIPANPAHAVNGPCARTASATLNACQADAEKNYWLTVATCRNATNAETRETCLQKADRTRQSALQDCAEQNTARLDVCKTFGGQAYAPKIKPENFVEVIDNPFLPLKPGTIRVYKTKTAGPDERIEVEVTNRTETILGVKCVVVRDRVTVNGVIVEDTTDWFAQDKEGNVWYFGEISRNYEDGRLVNLNGSWRAGVDGALPGVVMPADPTIGDTFRQEFAPGIAEDLAKVVSLTGKAEVPFTQCNDCVVTLDFTPLDPGIFEKKFYARGIGLILEIDRETGERLELINIRSDEPTR